MSSSDTVVNQSDKAAVSRSVKKKVPTTTQQNVIRDDNSLSITANAGSGKTSLLVDKLLHLLIEKDISLDNIAAITFTRKAAGEMKQKLADALQNRFLTENDPEIKAKLYSIRSKIASANIRTIHSFCKEIISSFPVEAGVDVNFSILEEQNTAQLITDIIEGTLTHADQGDEINAGVSLEAERLKELVRFFGGKKGVVSVTTGILAKRRLFTLFLEEYEKDGGDRKKKLEEFYHELSTSFFDVEFDEIIEKIRTLNSDILMSNPKSQIAVNVGSILEQLQNATEFVKKIEYCRNLYNQILLKDKTSIRVQGYSKGHPEKVPIEQAIQSHQTIKLRSEENAAPLDYTIQIEDLNQFQKEVAELGKFILQKYTERKQTEGMLDNEDLIIRTRELLSNKDIIASLQEKIRILMVDEYQDTDDIQYDIFKPILNDLTDEMHTLFIVGDKKQSIYSFREADLEVFEKTRSDIAKVQGNVHLLKESFRMAPAVAAFTNHLFRKLFENPRAKFNEVEFEETVCAYPHIDEGAVALLYAPEKEVPKGSGSRATKMDNKGRMIAKKIAQLSKDPGFSYSDVMVLARAHKSFLPLMVEFAKLGIPYVYSAGKNFYKSQVIKDISTFLSVLVDPLDREALVALLRSPFFMLSDEEIVSLATRKSGASSLWATIKDSEEPTLKKVFCILSGLVNESKVLSLPSLIKRIVTDTGLTMHAAKRYDGQQLVANIEKLIEIAQLKEAEGKTDLFDFSRFLMESIAESAVESDAELISEQGKVTLLTIHSAKGLQSKIVFLILDAKQIGAMQDPPVYLSKRYGPLGKLAYTNGLQGNKYEPWLMTYHKFVHKKKEEAELKRLLYVAVTRAENTLFLVLNGHLQDYGNPSRPDHLLYQFPELQVAELGERIQYTERLKRATLSPHGEWQEIEEEFKGTISVEFLDNMKSTQQDTDATQNLSPDVHCVPATPFLSELPSATSGEIVSASAYAMYKLCPLKYYLTFLADFGKVAESLDSIEEYEFQELEEEAENSRSSFVLSPALRGTLLHSLLEKRTPITLAEKDSEDFLTGRGIQITDEKLRSEVKSVIELYQNYIRSAFWTGMQANEGAFPEYKFYFKLNGFICHGVIDLLLETATEIFVIDYKSNNIQRSNVNIEAEKYTDQMNFYALAASRLFPEKQITTILSFMKHPDEPVKRAIGQDDLRNIETDIITCVKNMRESVFPPNQKACQGCKFAKGGNYCLRNA